MFQLTIRVDTQRADWFNIFKSCLTEQKLADYAVVVSAERNNTILVSIGGEQQNKRKIIETVKEILTKVYLTVVKKEYIERRLKLMRIDNLSKFLIINTLVAFDRENEEKILGEELELGGCFSMDGYFNFRMRELKGRWADICRLASDNSEYLANDDTVNELLKFLISAVNPKVNKAEISQYGNEFEVTEHNYGNTRKRMFDSFEQLMLYMIDVAPQKTVIKGRLSDNSLQKRLVSIFDIVENIL